MRIIGSDAAGGAKTPLYVATAPEVCHFISTTRARAHTHTHSLSLSHVSHRHCLAIVGVCRWQVLCERCRGTTRKQCIGSKCCSQAVEHQCRIDTDAFAHQIRYMAQRCTGAAASFTRFAAFDLGNSHKQAATCWYEAAHYNAVPSLSLTRSHRNSYLFCATQVLAYCLWPFSFDCFRTQVTRQFVPPSSTH
jgi:hypothetical protein